MASRLSFFLWSSIPDDELRRAAAAGELSNPQQFAAPGEAHARRPQGPPPVHRVLRPVARLLSLRSVPRRRYRRFPEFTDEVQELHVRRGRLVLRARRPQGPSGPRDPLRRLRLPEPAAGEVLRREEGGQVERTRWNWWRAPNASIAAACCGWAPSSPPPPRPCAPAP